MGFHSFISIPRKTVAELTLVLLSVNENKSRRLSGRRSMSSPKRWSLNATHFLKSVSNAPYAYAVRLRICELSNKPFNLAFYCRHQYESRFKLI